MVNTSRQAIEVCRREKNLFWSFQTFKPDATVELTSLGIHFPVADAYEKVIFPSNNDQPAEEANDDEVMALFDEIEPYYSRTNQMLAGL